MSIKNLVTKNTEIEDMDSAVAQAEAKLLHDACHWIYWDSSRYYVTEKGIRFTGSNICITCYDYKDGYKLAVTTVEGGKKYVHVFIISGDRIGQVERAFRMGMWRVDRKRILDAKNEMAQYTRMSDTILKDTMPL